MNFHGNSSAQRAPSPEKPVSDIEVEAANDPTVIDFEKFAGILGETRAILLNFRGTEKELGDLKKNLIAFNSALEKVDSWIDEAEDRADLFLSKKLKALKTSLKAEVEEINNRLID